MLTENKFNFFVYYVFPVIVMLMSMFGNTCGLIVMSKRKLKKMGPRNIYRLLFLVDFIYSFMNMNFYLSNFRINLTIYSAISCKLLVFFGYSIAPISAMLQVYISVERFCSIKYRETTGFLKRAYFQRAYIIVMVAFNITINSWVPFQYDLTAKKNDSKKNFHIMNHTQYMEECTLTGRGMGTAYLVLINQIIIPNSLIIGSTGLLLGTIFKSRRRSRTSYNRWGEVFLKDLKFAFSSLFLNFAFLLLNLPVLFVYFIFDSSPVLYAFCLYIYMLSFSINFYLIFISNSLFRSEFMIIFCFRKASNVNSNANTIKKLAQAQLLNETAF